MSELTPSPGTDLELADDEKLWAMLAHLSSLACLNLIGPIVALLVKQDSEFVKYHAIQALIYQLICLIVITVIGTVTCGIGYFAAPVVYIGSIWLGVQAYGGSWEGYPLLASIGKKPEA